MEISKFLVGVLTIAFGLLAAGQLTSAVVDLSKAAAVAQKEHQDFRLGDWNRNIGNK